MKGIILLRLIILFLFQIPLIKVSALYSKILMDIFSNYNSTLIKA